MFRRIKNYLLYNANQNNADSVSSKLRKKRLDFFLEYCNKFEKPMRILDLGGSDYFWRNSDFKNNIDYHITLININKQDTREFRNLSFIKRDVRDLKIFDDNEYDLVFSNSLIEHFNNFDEQKKLAAEIRRIGRHYFIQTPNYFFPVEPHFLFPFFQFLPESARTKLLTRYTLGWYKKQSEESGARELATSIRLLRRNELEKVFSDGKIYNEKYLFLNKSFIVYN